MGGRRGLPRAAFKIHDADDLKFLTMAAMPNIFGSALPAFVENSAQFLNIFYRIEPPAIGQRLRPMAFGDNLAKVPLMNANEVGRFCRCKQPNGFLRCRRECAKLMG